MVPRELPPCRTDQSILKLLPGPDRKRVQIAYAYRLIYRNPAPNGLGCRMLWEVAGGRLIYQIALEQDDRDGLNLHCTCADAIYRAEAEGRFCKHIRGLLELGISAVQTVDRLEPRVRLRA